MMVRSPGSSYGNPMHPYAGGRLKRTNFRHSKPTSLHETIDGEGLSKLRQGAPVSTRMNPTWGHVACERALALFVDISKRTFVYDARRCGSFSLCRQRDPLVVKKISLNRMGHARSQSIGNVGPSLTKGSEIEICPDDSLRNGFEPNRTGFSGNGHRWANSVNLKRLTWYPYYVYRGRRLLIP
ncbi:hypothetical protein EVAR_81882_1 [Eumeta japonica]|uniref:Uncharacterized protein n=1 Tax=Eumeta variegata TaxID=151549 RepID=A0A4C1UYW1_EUMVA|nr:hypothetical protein EVAR_81882_1 [Eumeta japonica]